MNNISNADTVKKQYSTADNLAVRISLHSKYSTNKQGFGNWIISHYDLREGMSVLELGCGTGEMWAGKTGAISLCSRFVLSDLSEGMLQKAKEVLNGCGGIEYRVADIQDIPFADGSFDIVIANMMLYHVPDLDKGLREVKRVLKDSGTFYCATYGENGLMEHILGLFKEYGVCASDVKNTRFTLQNGADTLNKYFKEVRCYLYEDSLAVTDVNDLADYIYSLSGLNGLGELPRDTVCSVLEKNMTGGVLTIPKEYGMFAAGNSLPDNAP